MRRQRWKQADRDIRSALRYRRTDQLGLDVRWPFVLLALFFMLALLLSSIVIRGGQI